MNSLRHLLTSLLMFIPCTLVHGEQRAGELRLEPYTLETRNAEKVSGELGRLVVPENRRNSQSRLIEIAFLRFKSTATEPGPPIVYLEGGPGGSGIDAARGPAFPILMAMREASDVILLDQRGTGMSRPLLTCASAWDFPLDQAENSPEQRRIAQEKIRACAREFRERGFDLAGYNTAESADDIDDLRRSLGAQKFSLWGISYGTHLALAVIRRHGEHIHRAVLAGVNGPDHEMMILPSTVEEQIDKVDRLLKANAEAAKLVPDFSGLVKTRLAEIAKQPVTVEVMDPKSRTSVPVTIGKTDLQLFTSVTVTTTWGMMNLPSTFGPLVNNDWQPLATRALERRRAGIGTLMGPLMVCSSGTSAERRARIEREAKEALFGNAINFLLPEICQALGDLDVGPGFRLPIQSNVPVLFISGTLDGRTPARNAEEVLKGFPNGVHLVIDGASHGYDLFYFFPSAKELMVGFLKGQAPVTNRITLPTFPFALPGQRPRN